MCLVKFPLNDHRNLVVSRASNYYHGSYTGIGGLWRCRAFKVPQNVIPWSDLSSAAVYFLSSCTGLIIIEQEHSQQLGEGTP